MTTSGAVGSTLQGLRFVGAVFPQAIKDNTEWVGSKDSTPVSIDTAPSGIKYNSAMVLWTIGATDVAIAEMNVFESDDDSTYTEIAGLDFITDGTAPSATADNTLYGSFIDLRDKKRYLRCDFKAGNGTVGSYGTVHFILADPTVTPTSDTARGLAASLST